MTRLIWPAIALCALFGTGAAAVAKPDDVPTTIAKARKTLDDIDKTIDGIDARKGGRTAMATQQQSGTARGRAAAANTNRAGNANANRANRTNRNRNRNNRPNPNPPSKTAKP